MSVINECEEKAIEELDEIVEDANEFKENRNLVVNIEKSTRSIARKYFDMLKDNEKGIIVNKFHIYCKMCFMHPDGKFIDTKNSTGNLLSH